MVASALNMYGNAAERFFTYHGWPLRPLRSPLLYALGPLLEQIQPET